MRTRPISRTPSKSLLPLTASSSSSATTTGSSFFLGNSAPISGNLNKSISPRLARFWSKTTESFHSAAGGGGGGISSSGSVAGMNKKKKINQQKYEVSSYNKSKSQGGEFRVQMPTHLLYYTALIFMLVPIVLLVIYFLVSSGSETDNASERKYVYPHNHYPAWMEQEKALGNHDLSQNSTGPIHEAGGPEDSLNHTTTYAMGMHGNTSTFEANEGVQYEQHEDPDQGMTSPDSDMDIIDTGNHVDLGMNMNHDPDMESLQHVELTDTETDLHPDDDVAIAGFGAAVGDRPGALPKLAAPNNLHLKQFYGNAHDDQELMDDFIAQQQQQL